MSPQTHRKQLAFTLVESLAVMFTIILLASILIPGLMGRGMRAPEIPIKLPTEEERIINTYSRPAPAGGAMESEKKEEEAEPGTPSVHRIPESGGAPSVHQIPAAE